LKLNIKPLIITPFLPCFFDFKEWDEHLEKFKERISHSQTEKNEVSSKGLFVMRFDGLGFLRGPNSMMFRLSKAAIKALKISIQRNDLNREKLYQLIGHTLDVSTIQVDTFFRQFNKFIGNSQIKFIEKPSSLPELKINLPMTIQWEITETCNLNCVHCYADATQIPKTNELNLKEVSTLIKTFSDYGVQSIHLLGGEPFMRDDLIQIIKTMTDLGIACHISTNGTLIDEKMGKKLSTFENITIDLSLDGICPNAHDSFRGVPGTFKKVKNALKILTHHNVDLNLTSVLGTQNISDVNELITIAIEYNATRIQLLTFSKTGRGGQINKKWGFNLDEIPKIRKQLINLIIEYIDKIYIDVPFMGLSPLSFRLFEILNYPGFENYYDFLFGCNAGLTKMTVDSSGTLMLCPQVRKRFGNLRKMDFIRAWELINRYAKKNLYCSQQNCSFLEFCGGKCRIPQN